MVCDPEPGMCRSPFPQEPHLSAAFGRSLKEATETVSG